MIPKQAIEKAIEGGWKNAGYEMCDNCGGSGGVYPDATCYSCSATGYTKDISEDWLEASGFDIALDKTFWQALGKALKWGEHWTVRTYGDEKDYMRRDIIETWRYWADYYLDIVLTGGDTEKFWVDLLA